MTVVLTEGAASVGVGVSESRERSSFPLDGELVVVSPAGGEPVEGYVFVSADSRRRVAAEGDAVVPVVVVTAPVRGVATAASFRVVSARVREVSSVRDVAGRVPLSPVRWTAAYTVLEQADAAASARKDAAAARSVLAELRVASARRLEELTESAHEYANDNDLCSVFDEFMRENGLRPRTSDYDVEIDALVRVRVTISRSASDGDAAREDVDSDDVTEAVANRTGVPSSDVDVSDWDVVEVTAV